MVEMCERRSTADERFLDGVLGGFVRSGQQIRDAHERGKVLSVDRREVVVLISDGLEEADRGGTEVVCMFFGHKQLHACEDQNVADDLDPCGGQA